MTLHVTPNEWEQAEAFFAANPNEIKFKKKDQSTHSFIRINDRIYALARVKNPQEGLINEGNFAKVKMAINKQRKIFTTKILGSKADFLPFFSFEVWNKLKRLIGFVYRHYFSVKEKNKLYLLTDYIEGQSLAEYIARTPISSELSSLLIALESCISLHELQLEKIVHRDIKPSNLILSKSRVHFIDFDFSLLLPEEHEICQPSRVVVCNQYAAPEALKDRLFSLKSDIFSLGMTFEKLNLPGLCFTMTTPDPESRITLPEVMLEIMRKIHELQLPLNNEALESLQRAIFIIEEGLSVEALFARFHQEQSQLKAIQFMEIPDTHSSKKAGRYVTVLDDNSNVFPSSSKGPLFFSDLCTHFRDMRLQPVNPTVEPTQSHAHRAASGTK